MTFVFDFIFILYGNFDDGADFEAYLYLFGFNFDVDDFSLIIDDLEERLSNDSKF